MSLPILPTRLRRIAEQARDRQRVFTTLAHMIDVELLREAFGGLRKKATPGIDGRTKAEYAMDLERNLEDLHERLRTRKYKASPARRAWIPKADGTQRPIAIMNLEDKIVQRGVAMLLEPIYEREFYDFSHGFRRERNAHQALQSLRDQIMEMKGVWLVDADIRGYFDHVPRGPLREVLKRRVNDGGILRLIGKWLHAGVLEGDKVHHPETGVPQGGVISPLLSNIYLHVVLDEWFVEKVQPRLQGRAFLIRFADDFVIGCEYKSDAERVLEVLHKRLGRYGLELHPEKTRLVRFMRPRLEDRKPKGIGTFDFLGFTHHWARSRQGNWVVKCRTMSQRLRRAQRGITVWCKRNRHRPLPEQQRILRAKLRGHYAYYGLTGNFPQLRRLHGHTCRQWRKWLKSRNRKGKLGWRKFGRLMKSYPLLPPGITQAAAGPRSAGQLKLCSRGGTVPRRRGAVSRKS